MAHYERISVNKQTKVKTIAIVNELERRDGVTQAYYPSGFLAYEQEWCDGTPISDFVVYHDAPGFKMKEKRPVRNGVFEGMAEVFDLNGERAALIPYYQGKKDGVARFFSDGVLCRTTTFMGGQKNGVERLFSPEGDTTSFYQDDQLHGEEVLTRHGRVLKRQFYHKGEKLFLQEFDDGGHLWRETLYRPKEGDLYQKRRMGDGGFVYERRSLKSDRVLESYGSSRDEKPLLRMIAAKDALLASTLHAFLENVRPGGWDYQEEWENAPLSNDAPLPAPAVEAVKTGVAQALKSAENGAPKSLLSKTPAKRVNKGLLTRKGNKEFHWYVNSAEKSLLKAEITYDDFGREVAREEYAYEGYPVKKDVWDRTQNPPRLTRLFYYPKNKGVRTRIVQQGDYEKTEHFYERPASASRDVEPVLYKRYECVGGVLHGVYEEFYETKPGETPRLQTKKEMVNGHAQKEIVLERNGRVRRMAGEGVAQWKSDSRVLAFLKNRKTKEL